MIVAILDEINVMMDLKSLCVEVVVFHGDTQALEKPLEDFVGRLEQALAVVCREMTSVMPQWTYDCDIVLRDGSNNRVTRICLELGEPRNGKLFIDWSSKRNMWF